jgi:fructokinase
MILSCGESLIDLVVGPPAGGGFSCMAVPGGSPFNVAIGVARLGGKAGFLSKISKDFFGRSLTRALAAAGVDRRCVVSCENQTTLSVAVTRDDGQADYAFYGHDAADRCLHVHELPACLPDDVAAIAIGSYSLAIDPTASAIEHLIARDGAQRIVSIDPNIRPNIVGDPAKWRPRFERLLARCDIVKASTEDLHAVYGAGMDRAAWARQWLRAGLKLVVITGGAAGARTFFGTETFDVPAREVQVADTVGAGDSFHAALLVSLQDQGILHPQKLGLAPIDCIRRATRFASAASSITCSRRGADLPSRADVEAVVKI